MGDMDDGGAEVGVMASGLAMRVLMFLEKDPDKVCPADGDLGPPKACGSGISASMDSDRRPKIPECEKILPRAIRAARGFFSI